MKFLRLRIRRRKIENRTHYDYPDQYDAKKVKVGPIYEGGMDEQAKVARDRNLDDEYILVGVDDQDLSLFLSADGVEKDGFTYHAEEVDIDTAKTTGDGWTRQVEKITDQEKVIKILSKVALGQALDQKEKDSINPEHPEPGIIKTKKFSETLDDILKSQ